MQCTYILAKVKAIDPNKIRKLVVTNPYTNGLKQLMFALNSNSEDDKRKYFKQALNSLSHIKYYYLEATYFYCLFLKEINDAEFDIFYNSGLEQCKKFKYQGLHYKFSNIHNLTPPPYICDYQYFGIPNFDFFLESYNQYWEKKFREDHLNF